MELVFAGLARHLRQTLVRFMNYTIADIAILRTISLLLNISLPLHYCLNHISILELENLTDLEHPLPLLIFRYFQSFTELDIHDLDGVVIRDLDFESDLNLTLFVGCEYFFSRFEERELKIIGFQLRLGDLNFLDFILKNRRADYLFDIRQNDF